MFDRQIDEQILECSRFDDNCLAPVQVSTVKALCERIKNLETELKATQARLDVSDELLREEFAQRQDAIATDSERLEGLKRVSLAAASALDGWHIGRLEELREQAKDKNCRAAQQAYINGLEYELRNAIPDGWQLVPKELDGNMTHDLGYWLFDMFKVRGENYRYRKLWEILLAAAPKKVD